MRTPLPPQLLEHAQKFGGTPVVPRDAATIVLLRDGSQGTETYLLRRQATMAFAPGVHVFPGGTVQESDHLPITWIGPAAERWSNLLRCDVRTVSALMVAAVRETFEESGILLAGPDAHLVVQDTSGDVMQEARLRLDAGQISLVDFLAEQGLILRADLLGVWGHWVTPEFEPRRYDTRFFVAAAPRGQTVGPLPGEADQARWLALQDIVQSVDDECLTMLPPTALTCQELAGRSIEDILSSAVGRRPGRRTARLVEEDGQHFLEHLVD